MDVYAGKDITYAVTQKLRFLLEKKAEASDLSEKQQLLFFFWRINMSTFSILNSIKVGRPGSSPSFVFSGVRAGLRGRCSQALGVCHNIKGVSHDPVA